MKFLPSKKVVFSFLIVVLLLFVFLRQGSQDKAPEEKQRIGSEDLVSKEFVNDVATKDIDNDGLADWEEALWKTDSNNSDTDGDGTPDGEEVSLGRDPKIAGPDDQLTTRNLSQNKSGSPTDESLTATEKFGRNLFTSYAQLITNPIFRGNKSDVLYNSLSRDILAVPGPRQYFLSELNITTRTDVEVLKKYANALVLNLRRGGELNELVEIVKIFDTKGVEGLTELEEVIQANTEILFQNLDLVTPAEVARIHLALINNHNGIIDAMLKMTKIKTDPLLATIGIGEYSKSTTAFKKTFNDLRQYFSAKGIKFKINEPGVVLNK